MNQLADTCSFGVLKADMTRDRLVLGSKDQGARIRLFREEECTLERALKTLKISEVTDIQMKHMTGESHDEVNYGTQAKDRGPSRQAGKGATLTLVLKSLL